MKKESEEGAGVFRLKRPIRAYTFAALFANGQWVATDTFDCRSEAVARELIEVAVEKKMWVGSSVPRGEVQCDHGGLGNWRRPKSKHDPLCAACCHETECEHMSALRLEHLLLLHEGEVEDSG